MEIRYRVFDNKTLEDITDEFQWIITPDGKLCYVDYGDVIEDKSVCFELMVKQNGEWKLIK